VGFRLAAAAAVLALVHAGAAAASSNPASRSWAAPEIKTVTAAGLMDGKSVAAFRANDPLTAQALEDLVFGLKQAVFPPEPELEEPVVDPVPVDPTLPVDPTTTTMTTTTTPAPVPVPAAPKQVANPDKPVTMAQLDTRLVQALGLIPAAQTFTKGAKAAGLKVPSRFGTEVVARLLGLRTNHPANEDSLELLPNDPATRAEAAYSAAQILHFSDWQVAGVQSLADGFALPSFSAWQTKILDTAVARIGMPYIWGGVSDGPATAFGVPSRGGYDCSGFVWRVYKLELYPGAGLLPSVLRGRTTYEMSAEVPKSQRIGLAKLEPADVIFFGDKGPRSQPSQVGHMGIYVGNGWFIHSSGYGVALATLDGWYTREFAWGRRPLREAGLGA
jgi:cell wall-associated NlpC family hydrolase